MRYSNLQVEQVDLNGNIIHDFSEWLSPKELITIINDNFNTRKEQDENCYGYYKGNTYCLCIKNISYLGNPHPYFKKRIQIPKSFIETYKKNKLLNIPTFFIGVYKYKSNLIFVDFDTTNYIHNRAHNSSAHTYVMDIVNATIKGIYNKHDSRNNEITAFRPDFIETFLESKIIGDLDLRNEVIKTFDKFFMSIPYTWYGIPCYQEMIDNKFNNKFQSEWPGFYLEFKVSQYIKQNNKTGIIEYKQNKRKGDIDLDLFFPKMNIYGDLKAHSNYSSAIQGNDFETIMTLIEDYSIYYIVFNHDTKKDKDNDYLVTEFWNLAQGKDNLISYGNKMKSSITITDYMILEINKTNIRYLDEFKQGVNSNGKERKKKIMIKKRNIENFIIYRRGAKNG